MPRSSLVKSLSFYGPRGTLIENEFVVFVAAEKTRNRTRLDSILAAAAQCGRIAAISTALALRLALQPSRCSDAANFRARQSFFCA